MSKFASQADYWKDRAHKAEQELLNIVNAERFNRERFRDDTEFADWAQSRCRHAVREPQSRPTEGK